MSTSAKGQHLHQHQRRRLSSSNSGNHSNSQSHPQREQQAKPSRDFPGVRTSAWARVCELRALPSCLPSFLHFHPPAMPRVRAPAARLRPQANESRTREGAALLAGCDNLDSANRARSVRWSTWITKTISNQNN